jgi:hypothetical protein
MRTTLIACALILIGTTSASAQSQSTIDKASAHANSCMMMSDSMSTALGLTAEQEALVKVSDERCLKACELVGYRATGKMDDAAMRTHDADMKEILTTAQYARWNSMCSMGKAQGTTPAPMKY